MPALRIPIKQAIRYRADKCGLPPELVAAIVLAESGGNPWAFRVEPLYRWLYNPTTGAPFNPVPSGRFETPEGFTDLPGTSRITAWVGQKTSWGLMQVMGAVAREYGWKGSFTALCHPRVGLYFGCKHLSRLHARYNRQYGLPGVIAAYNAGSPRLRSNGDYVNQAYVDHVLALMDTAL